MCYARQFDWLCKESAEVPQVMAIAASIRFGDVLPHGRSRSGAGLYLLTPAVSGRRLGTRSSALPRGDAGGERQSAQTESNNAQNPCARYTDPTASTGVPAPARPSDNATQVLSMSFCSSVARPSGDRDCRLRSGILGSPCRRPSRNVTETRRRAVVGWRQLRLQRTW